MTTAYQDIRAGLQKAAAAAVASLSVPIAYDGFVFEPDPDSPWLRLSFIPTSSDPYVSCETFYGTGILQADGHYPHGVGTASLETACAAILGALAPGTIIRQWSERVEVVRAERLGAPFLDAQWTRQTMEIHWRANSTRA